MSNKPITEFGRPPGTTPDTPVFVGPGVDPRVAAHAAGIAARRGGAAPPGLPKYNAPVGGGKGVPIPRLDAPHVPGATMAQQAENINSPPQHLQVMQATQQHALAPGSIIEPAFMPGQQAPSRGAPPPQLDLQPQDMLPEEALRDPECRPGTGANFAVNQPHLAARYGVVRGGQRVPPQALVRGAQRRPQPMPGHPGAGAPRELPRGNETLRDLQALAQAQQVAAQRAAALPQTEEEAEREVLDHSSASSAGAGDPPAPARELTEDEEKRAKAAIEAMDSFDYDAFRQQMTINQLSSPDQRKLIEGRLKPLEIDELIMKNRVSQDVPIVSGFTIRFTSMTGEDDLALKRLLMVESKSVEVTERYLLDKFAFMALTAGLSAINANPAPSHLNEKGEFDEKKFWVKFNWVMQRPLHMLASIGQNHTWFEMRVRKLFVASHLGNG